MVQLPEGLGLELRGGFMMKLKYETTTMVSPLE